MPPLKDERISTNSLIQLLNKMTTFSIYKYSIVFICLLSANSHLRADDSTLCEPVEKVIFSCGFKNAKTVSICGSSDNAQSYVEYRFGRANNIEFKFRASAKDPKHQFHRGEIAYANNSEDMIWFRNGKFRYSIFMPTRGGPGVEISRDSKVEARLECSGGWGNIKGKRTMESKFIIEHGSGDLSKFEPLWTGQ